MNNRAIDSSLSKLNSGFRINSAADDASGMAIADSLRSQASSLGKAIMNANDAIGIIQTADKAMDEQIKILETIKNKAIQSAQDGQTTETRKALQADISRLMEELDNIGNTTSFNGQKLLSGTFSNKEFQIGAYSNETVKASIGATTSDKIGLTRFETGHNVRAADLTGSVSVTFKNVDGINDVTIEKVQLTNGKGDTSATTGLGALAEAINKASDKTGIKASVTAQTVFEQPIKAGETTSNFSINGVKIGTVNVQEKDANGALRAAINAVKDQTGVEASVDTKGRLVLANRDGRGIKVEDNVTTNKPTTDMHSLVTQGATGNPNAKKGVDFNTAATWTTAAGTPAGGSILIKENSFADVKNAHGVQDALIYKDGTTKAVNNSVPYQELKKIQDAQSGALDTLKDKLKDIIKTNILDKSAATGQGTQKATLDGHALTAIKAIDNSANLNAISTALTTLDGNLGTVNTTITGATQDAFQTAFASAVKDFVIATDSAAKEAQKNLRESGADVTAGAAQTLNNQLNTLLAGTAAALDTTTGLGQANAANAFAAIATYAGIDNTFNTTGTQALQGREVDFTNLAAEKIGALNLAVNTAGTSGIEKEITDLFNDLKTQKTIDGANSTIDKINQKLDKLIDAADGKTMDTKEAQEGMVAHSFKQFFAGLKAGINEPTKAGLSSIVGLDTTNSTNMGRLSLVANNGRDIQVEVKDANGFTTNSAIGYDKNVSEATVSLRETNATINKAQADAMGFNANEWQAGDNGDNQNGYAAGVMTLKGAQAMMNIAETAQKALEAIRSDLGSVQNQLVSTVNNISVTQVNVKAAESNIRDVDFAEESATFSKHQILAQSGVYAMSQANAVQQNVMRLLQ
ncbi:flagellin [Campylobacter sp. RM5004]|nr:flagellin [Campylobacter sp. RM5004]